MKIFIEFFCLSFSFRDMKIHFFAFLLLASIIVQPESVLNSLYQKQLSRSVLRKMCSENMQQIYWTRPMPKYDLLNLHFAMGVVNLLLIFRTPFPKNTSAVYNSASSSVFPHCEINPLFRVNQN